MVLIELLWEKRVEKARKRQIEFLFSIWIGWRIVI